MNVLAGFCCHVMFTEIASDLLISCILAWKNRFSHLGEWCGMLPNWHLPFTSDEQALWRDQLIRAHTDRLGKIQHKDYKLRTFQVL